jgi:predicted trehalose synthase
MLTFLYIVLMVAGAAILASFLWRKPRYVVSTSGATSSDSMAAYEQRIGELGARLDSMKAVLARRSVLGGVAVRLRISQVEQHLAKLKEAVRIWRSAHDQYGVGQAYRECLLLYGSAQSACQALSYDTLPPEADTVQAPPR